MRSYCYSLARLLGDLRALSTLRIVKRIVNKLIGRTIVSRLWWR